METLVRVVVLRNPELDGTSKMMYARFNRIHNCLAYLAEDSDHIPNEFDALVIVPSQFSFVDSEIVNRVLYLQRRFPDKLITVATKESMYECTSDYHEKLCRQLVMNKQVEVEQ